MSRIQKLEELIVYHKALYYQGRPEISDHEYDDLETELKKLHPGSSVLEIVGSLPTSLKKVKHDSKMLSLDKTYVLSDLKKWIGKNVVVSCFKIDGVSCSLIYEDGKLVTGKTRGDGSVGENITSKVMWIESIPKIITNKSKVEIRGELYCTEENFFHLSDEMASIGLERPTSQRNIVAGLISRKENLELSRYINFKCFEYISSEKKAKSEQEKWGILSELKFDVPELTVHMSLSSIQDAIKEAEDFMAEGNYQIDGLVITIDDNSLHDELGSTAHHPRYKIAFKFQGESRTTKINNIIWSVSRNGILTPVADVEPVDLSGAKISRVTLHNYGMVKLYGLKKNDEIKIVRSGEVIPKFLEVTKKSRSKFFIPETCPACTSEVIIDDIRLRCSNKKCPGKIKEEILNFIQKIGIDDLSSKRLDEMIRVELVSDIVDLYRIKKEDLLALDKTKEKLATKILSNIQASRDVDLITFLSALGITGGAYNKCEKVVSAGFDSVEKLMGLTVEELSGVDGFAEKSSGDFIRSLKEKKSLVNKLIKKGFSFEKFEAKETAVLGKKVCITGSLSEKRAIIEKRIRDYGGAVVGSVSKNTDYLLTNDPNSGSGKAKKARDLGITILTEKELLKLLE